MTEHEIIQRKDPMTERREESQRQALAPSRHCAFALTNPTLRDYLLPRLLSGRVRVGNTGGDASVAGDVVVDDHHVGDRVAELDRVVGRLVDGQEEIRRS